MTGKLLVSAMLLCAVLFSVSLAAAADGGTIAVAAEGQSAASQVSKRLVRSPYFLFFDEKGGLAEVVANPYRQASDAGPRAVDFLAAKGVRTIIAGEFGPKIAEFIKLKKMSLRTVTGSAADAVKSAMKK